MDDEAEGGVKQDLPVITKRKHINPLSNHLKFGVIGMVNVGKSSLFNVISQSQSSDTENALFSTIGNASYVLKCQFTVNSLYSIKLVEVVCFHC